MFVRTESFQEFIRYYPIVTTIILIHILLYVLSFFPFFPYETLIGINLYIAEGEFWRLITPIFLHGGFAHLLFNSFSLVLFGPALERILGRKKFILLYLSAGILANIATFIFKPLTYIHVGSSGAIFGLFGVYFAMILFRREWLSWENRQIIMTIAILSIIMTLFTRNINVTAHIFGLLSGFIIGAIMIGRGQQLKISLKKITPRKGTYPSSKNQWFWIILIILALLGLFSL